MIFCFYRLFFALEFHRSKTIMKTFILCAFSCLALVVALPSFAQTYSEIHSFSFNSSNTDGSFPYACPILSGDILYGTTFGGGSNDNGVIYSVRTDGSQFTDLHSFGKTSGGTRGTNSDGSTCTTPLT